MSFWQLKLSFAQHMYAQIKLTTFSFSTLYVFFLRNTQMPMPDSAMLWAFLVNRNVKVVVLQKVCVNWPIAQKFKFAIPMRVKVKKTKKTQSELCKKVRFIQRCDLYTNHSAKMAQYTEM